MGWLRTVKDDHLVCAWDVVQEEALDFGVVVLFDRLVVGEGGFGRGGLVLQDLEGIFVESEGGFLASSVVDEHVVGDGTKITKGDNTGRNVTSEVVRH